MRFCNVLTFLFLQCVIDTEQQIMVIGTTVREQIHFAKKQFSEG